MFAMDIEDDILLSVNDICDFVELDGNIVASDTFCSNCLVVRLPFQAVMGQNSRSRSSGEAIYPCIELWMKAESGC